MELLKRGGVKRFGRSLSNGGVHGRVLGYPGDRPGNKVSKERLVLIFFEFSIALDLVFPSKVVVSDVLFQLLLPRSVGLVLPQFAYLLFGQDVYLLD